MSSLLREKDFANDLLAGFCHSVSWMSVGSTMTPQTPLKRLMALKPTMIIYIIRTYKPTKISLHSFTIQTGSECVIMSFLA